MAGTPATVANHVPTKVVCPTLVQRTPTKRFKKGQFGVDNPKSTTKEQTKKHVKNKRKNKTAQTTPHRLESSERQYRLLAMACRQLSCFTRMLWPLTTPSPRRSVRVARQSPSSLSTVHRPTGRPTNHRAPATLSTEPKKNDRKLSAKTGGREPEPSEALV
ncbi:hypothetical protein BDY19DRAFT_954757 [Irpex rosettiformis]|uniref:Uncharacterized protein n=1 Tax=Irpex rosettiformis TaxID=378272 RepID=A0ACB8U0C4_9APHY|nr:hypothetical protein BDY19DRAFT_954757 [Irpex rosettiformis]